MATWTGCLCLILTLWMAGSGRPAIDRTVASDPWWGTKEAHEIKSLAEGYRAARDFAAVEAVDQRGLERSLQRGDDRAAFTYLTGMGAARLLQYRYRDAFDALSVVLHHGVTRLESRFIGGAIGIDVRHFDACFFGKL